jgi:hypothetical protein
MEYDNDLHLSTFNERPSDTLRQDLTTEPVPILWVVAVYLPARLKQVRRSDKAV